MRTLPALISATVALFFCVGCAQTHTSNTARTGTEQLLISNAVDLSLNKVDFTALHGRKVFLDSGYLDGVDKQYVIASLRHHLLHNGATLATSADESDVVLEARSGAIGTDTTESYYGIPGIALPGGIINLPEIKLVTRMNQYGTAKIGLVAYETATRAMMDGGGISIARAEHNNWHVFGVGPITTGTLKKELKASTSDNAPVPERELPRTIAFRPDRSPNSTADPLNLLDVPGRAGREVQQAGHAEE